VIYVGQDALGGWAWMLMGRKGLVQSGSGWSTAEKAMDDAADAWAEASIRGEPGIGKYPMFVFPDGGS